MTTQESPTIGRVEFIALMGMMFATIAFSIDAMLPALPQIADDLTGGDAAQAALILTVFLMGMGLGTFFTGPCPTRWGASRWSMPVRPSTSSRPPWAGTKTALSRC